MASTAESLHDVITALEAKILAATPAQLVEIERIIDDAAQDRPDPQPAATSPRRADAALR